MSYDQKTMMYEGYIYCVENLINSKKYCRNSLGTASF